MINYNQFRIFYHAAKNLSFTAAAGELFLTQPAITAQIKAFEAHCGMKLFIKKGRGIHLTEQGRTLFEYARQVFEHEKEIENVIEEMKEVKQGVLRLGTTKAYARYFMPSLISSFHKAYPHIKIHLDEGSSLDMINSLVELKNEVAVIAKAADNPKVAFVPFSQEELVAILPQGHPLARKKAVDFSELAKEPIIMKEVGSGTRKLVNTLFINHNCTPNVLMETGNSEFVKQLVQQGEGISFLVRAAVALELKEKKLATVRLQGPQIYLDVSFAYLKDIFLSPPAKAFVEVLRKLWAGDIRPQDIGSLMVKILAQKR
ncbi:MAG: LysR family transcriptional regulator [Desulfobacterales bacterium]|nr:LysR family transcriptional regulator [Desulfobacterales bacterium]